MGVLNFQNLTYDKTLYEVDFKVKGTLLIDGNSKEDIENELNDYLKDETKSKFLIGMLNSVKNGDIEINEIKEIF